MKEIILVLVFFVGYTFSQNKIHNPEITAEEIKANVSYLASDEMKGRFSGSKEELKVANYIKNEFAKFGLKPVFNSKWFQEFPFIEKVVMTNKNSLQLTSGSEKKSLKAATEFSTLGFSSNSKITSEIVFVGYGISAGKLNYDDYAGIDVKGKTVIIMKNHPEHDSSKSEFEKFVTLRNKANTAKEKGAVAIIFVNGFAPKNDDELPAPKYDSAPPMKDIAIVQIKREIINELLKKSGHNFEGIQKEIDKNKKPNSFALPNLKIRLTTEVKQIEKTARNVGGFLEGTDPVLKNEYIVIGGHYDHLGIDQMLESSMYKGKDKQIHNGADDNASGTAGVIEVAEKFASMKNQLKRSIIFVTFSGEELGILGSTYFTNNSPADVKNITSMFNLDMIGRLNDENSLTIIGSGTSSKWKELLNEKNKYGFKLGMSDGGSGGSDHQSFSNKNIPVLFFFTGTHSDYHKPSDDANKINSAGEAKIVNYVFDLVSEVQKLEKRLDYVKVEEVAPRPTGRSRVSVGTVPEFGYNGNGYKISGVTEGSPASKAGMKAGDIITKFGKKAITNIYDFMYATQDYKAGDKVELIALRDGKEMTFNLELIAK